MTQLKPLSLLFSALFGVLFWRWVKEREAIAYERGRHEEQHKQAMTTTFPFHRREG